MKIFHAWYSKSADEEYGHNIYLDRNGKEVKVTVVCASFEQGDDSYRWHDKEYVGEVTKFVRCNDKDKWGYMR
jgi:hypothetical protein